jgi:acetyl esterase/lipase
MGRFGRSVVIAVLLGLLYRFGVAQSKSMSQNARGLAHFATPSKQNVPVPFSLAKTTPVIAGGSKTSPQALAKPVAAQPVSPPTLSSLFSDLSYQYTGGGYHDKRFRYRLFVPENTDPPQKLPLIVWLHGFGEAGNATFFI